jgi:hypothetical protein
MINKIMHCKEIQEKPPVLIEVGASGKISRSWKKIAKYSICIAFDADLRDFQTEVSGSGYKRLIKINKLVLDIQGTNDFFLTRYSHCSSSLKPDKESLNDWLFRDYFIVDKVSEMTATTLSEVLDTLKIDYLDWFKIDSQGTDLRIFKQLKNSIRNKVLVAEFEPGLADTYLNEDKLHSILKFMNEEFFIDKVSITGEHRIMPETAKKIFTRSQLKLFQLTDNIVSNQSAIFANITFLNCLKNRDTFTKRDVLLFLALLITRKQYLFCFEICEYYKVRYNDQIFSQISKHCKRKVWFGMWTLIYYIPWKIYVKIRKDYF